VNGRTALVVDDGIATGATVRAALHAIRRAEPAHLVLAAPVAPPETIEKLRSDADEIVCLATPENFWAISMFYGVFPQLDDAAVSKLMDRAALGAPPSEEPASGSR
jgi:putative phosphoribosyl transferase